MSAALIEEGPRYQPSRDQLEVASSIADALADLLPIARVHRGSNEAPEIWSALSDLGLFSLGGVDEDPGCGLSVAEVALIVTELGRRLASPSVLATVGAGYAHWTTLSARTDDGLRVAAAYVEQGRTIVIDDPDADLILVRSDAPRLHAAPRDARRIDDAVWAVALSQVDGLGAPVAEFDDRNRLRLRLLDAAALAGLAQAAQEMAVEYAGVRKQFGHAIGSFQAVKHRCANMALASRSARDLVTFAAMALDEDRCDAPLLVESALLIAGAAALDNAGANIQVHGGIGFSDEADPHLLLKRAHVLLALAGGLEAASGRVAAIESTEDLAE